MNKFLIKTIFFCIASFIILLILDILVTKSLKKSDYENFKDWKEIYSGSINADLIINGSSKATRQFSPKIMDTILNLETYNLGIIGHNYFLQRIKYQTYISHNTSPKYLIQVVSNSTFEKREDLFDYPQFLPYIKDSLIRSAIKHYEGLSKIDFKFPFFRYLKNINEIAKGVFVSLNLFEHIDYEYRDKGYYGLSKNWDKSFERYVEKNPKSMIIQLHEESLQLFHRDLKRNIAKGVQTIMVYPPMYFEVEKYFSNIDSIKSIYKTIANDYNITYLDYSQDTICFQKKYFFNSQHLNKTGAELFSEKFANDIKSTIINF